MTKFKCTVVALMTAAIMCCCLPPRINPESATGVKKVNTNVKTQANGRTVEQNNIVKRLAIDNKPGSIKHLYVISAMSGQVILYSTVKGKVTSSGKRLTPYRVASHQGGVRDAGILVTIGGQIYYTPEVLQDDGTYGSSIPYMYWWDTHGKYHQHYVSGGQIIHISDKPIAVKRIILNLHNKVRSERDNERASIKKKQVKELENVNTSYNKR